MIRSYLDIDQDYVEACEWATARLASGDFVILTMETTGFDGEVIEVAVLGADETTHFNRRVQPFVPITASAQAIHGIAAQDLVECPRLVDVLPDLDQALSDKLVVVYDAELTIGCMRRSLLAAGWSMEEILTWLRGSRWRRLMAWYARWVGDWNTWQSGYRWPRLEHDDHSALGAGRAAAHGRAGKPLVEPERSARAHRGLLGRAGGARGAGPHQGGSPGAGDTNWLALGNGGA